MRAFLSRFVVLVNAALLAAPPGWCCFFAAQSSKKAAAPPPACSCCCKSKPQPESQSPQNQSQKKPVPPLPIRTCCIRADFVPAKAPETPAADLTLAILPRATHASHPPAASPSEERFAFLDASPPRHVLQCVWRC